MVIILFLSNSAVALDIGSRYIKAVYGRKTAGFLSILDYGIFEARCSHDFDMEDSAILHETVSNILCNIGLKSGNIIIGIGGQEVITRHIELPYIKKEYLRQAAEFEFKHYLPINSKEFVIRSKYLGKHVDKRNTVDMLMIAVPKRIVDFYINLVNCLGYDLMGICTYPNSITNFLLPRKMTKNCIAMADIGYNSTKLFLIEKGRFYIKREINTGCRDLESTGCSKTYLENAALYNLFQCISETFDFYLSSKPGMKIECLYLYGGGSKMPGTLEAISSFVNIETRLVGEKMLRGIHKIDNTLLDRIHLYLNCMSLLYQM